MHNRMVFPSLFHRTVSGNPHLSNIFENPVISAHIIDGGRRNVKMRYNPAALQSRVKARPPGQYGAVQPDAWQTYEKHLFSR